MGYEHKYVNDEVSVIIDTKDGEKMTVEETTDRLKDKTYYIDASIVIDRVFSIYL